MSTQQHGGSCLKVGLAHSARQLPAKTIPANSGRSTSRTCCQRDASRPVCDRGNRIDGHGIMKALGIHLKDVWRDRPVFETLHKSIHTLRQGVAGRTAGGRLTQQAQHIDRQAIWAFLAGHWPSRQAWSTCLLAERTGCAATAHRQTLGTASRASA